MVLVPKEVILVFGQQLFKQGLPLGDARDVEFCLDGPVNWAGREAQVEMIEITIQEGHQAIADVIVEKRTKARGPGCPQRTTKTNWTPTAVYNIKEWM